MSSVLQSCQLSGSIKAQGTLAGEVSKTKIIEGLDGFSPTVEVEAIESGNRLTITDINGSIIVDVMNGENGKTPEKGVDYYTEEDKAEMVELVLAAIPSAEGVAF